MQYQESLSEKLNRLATDKWPAILQHGLGIDARYLVNRHGPCPVCGGKDRFRFDNKDGTGRYYCSQCGGSGAGGFGDGISLVMKIKGLSFKDAAKWVIEDYLGDPGRARHAEVASRAFARAVFEELDDATIAKRRSAFRDVWTAAHAVEPGDPVWLYLAGRLPGLPSVPKMIRFHPGLDYVGPQREGGKPGIRYGKHPCMVSAVLDDAGRCCNVHRTYLTQDGKKLDIVEGDVSLPVKKLMPAVGVKSYAVRLASHHGELGVCEGIETALAASLCEKVPSWALVSTSGMKSFNVPADVRSLVVFADNDERTSNGRRPGFEAATALAEKPEVIARVKARQLKVRLVTPARRGQDMVDYLLEKSQVHQRMAA